MFLWPPVPVRFDTIAICVHSNADEGTHTLNLPHGTENFPRESKENKISPRGRREAMPPPMAVRRWQKLRRIYVRPRTVPQSAHLWWPAVAKLQAASVPIA